MKVKTKVRAHVRQKGKLWDKLIGTLCGIGSYVWAYHDLPRVPMGHAISLTSPRLTSGTSLPERIAHTWAEEIMMKIENKSTYMANLDSIT